MIKPELSYVCETAHMLVPLLSVREVNHSNCQRIVVESSPSHRDPKK
jgi:hypothetical protein